MKYNSGLEVLGALMQAYYEERNIEAALDCVTDDVQWVGTEGFDNANGKDELRKLLEADVEAFPDSFQIELGEPMVQEIRDDVVMIVAFGKQVAVPNVICGFSIRGTVCCVKQDGGWLVRNVHTSVPNTEMEKYSLTQELDETRKKEQTLMAGIPGGVAIYRLKKDGRVVTDYVSETLAKMCGYSTGEFLAYLQEDARINLVPEDIPTVIEAVVESLSKHIPVNVDYRIYTKDRQELLIRLDANVISEAQLNEDDVAILYAVHTKVSEETLQIMKEQQRYRAVMDTLDIAFLEWDVDNGFYASEKYADYAMSDEDYEKILKNEGNPNLVHPDDLQALYQFFQDIKKNDAKGAVTLRFLMKDGTYRWTEMLAFFDYDSPGKMNRVIGILRDIDKEWMEQNKRLQTALDSAEMANRAKTDFLSRVSHDMRTPLNGILGLTTLLKDNLTDEKALQDLQQLELSGQYLLNLINDTLDVSKIESGKLELHPTVCDGRTVFQNVLNLARPNIQAKQLQFYLHADNLPFTTLYIDVGRVEQIVMNILGNAVKFTPVGGRIDFYMSNITVENGMITDKVVVVDTGIGMSPEFLPHLFEPFTQENSTRTSLYQGTGLGMAITKQIVELMGGEISVESEQGKGTRFTFTLKLPIATEEQIATWKKCRKADVDDRILCGKRVLLCEDHPLNATIAIRLLKNKGIQVEHAENGSIGVEMFANSAVDYYDAVLMDIRMPVLDGIDAAKRIRSLERIDAKCVPIIAMTANAFEEDVRQTKEAGMNAHLSKPIETEKLYHTLKNFLCDSCS